MVEVGWKKTRYDLFWLNVQKHGVQKGKKYCVKWTDDNIEGGAGRHHPHPTSCST
jgi:hypothetical protein